VFTTHNFSNSNQEPPEHKPQAIPTKQTSQCDNK